MNLSFRSLLTGRLFAHRTPQTPATRKVAFLQLEALEDRFVPSTVTLGAAANFGVLGLQGTQIDNSLVTIYGNEGVSACGTLKNMAPSTVTSNVFEAYSGQYTGPGKLGGLSVSPGLLAQADSDALTAASQAAALTPTQVLGSISSPTTVTGNGGLNVIDVNGDIKASLILSGSANDVFIVNVTGMVTFGGNSTLGLAGGVTADHVLYNFTGSEGTITTHVGNVLDGTLLAPNYSFNLDGGFSGEIIGGGGNIGMLSGTKVCAVPFQEVVCPPACLSGQVTNFCTGAGIPCTTVMLEDSCGDVIAQTQTDANGCYLFTIDQPGTYEVVVAQPPWGYSFGPAYVGTVNGQQDGYLSGSGGEIDGIALCCGSQGSHYDFTEVPSGTTAGLPPS